MKENKMNLFTKNLLKKEKEGNKMKLFGMLICLWLLFNLLIFVFGPVYTILIGIVMILLNQEKEKV